MKGPIRFTDDELFEVMVAIHNHTRPGQYRKEIKAQGTAANKIDAEIRRRAFEAKKKEV